MLYTVTHTYVTRNDDDEPAIGMEFVVTETALVATVVQERLANPGGRSGTTITLTVTCGEPPSLA